MGFFLNIAENGNELTLRDGKEFSVELSQGINIEGTTIEANQKYDYTIKFPDSKMTKDVSTINWGACPEAEGYIFQTRQADDIQSVITRLNIQSDKNLKRDARQEIFEYILGTGSSTAIGSQLSTGQGIAFMGAQSILDVLNIKAEVDIINKNLDKQIEQAELGVVLSALGIEDVQVQVNGTEANVQASMGGKETYERLSEFYIRGKGYSEEEADKKARDEMNKWFREGYIDVGSEELGEYENWYRLNRKVVENEK